MQTFSEVLRDRVVVYDGAMGTSIHTLGLNVDDYWNKEGCNELLVLSRPDVIRGIHASFLQVGCDVIETDTFGSSRIVLAEYQLQEKTCELNLAAAILAKEVAAQFSTPQKPRFVAGSIGPTTRLPSMGQITYDAMAESYREQIVALIQGGVDLLQVETCQDLLQAKIALAACQDAMRATGKRLPIQVQVTIDGKGRMFLGSKISAALAVLECFQPDVIGINCSTGPREMTDTVRFLCENATRHVSVLPNAGLPQSIDGHAAYALTPADLAFHLKQFVEEYGARVVGGCCGTTPEHLHAVVEAVEHVRPAKTDAVAHSVSASAYTSISLEATGSPIIVAEQMNTATRSPVFREMVRGGDYGGILALSKSLAREGSQLLDICCAIVGEDEQAHMSAVLDQIASRLPLPVLIDSAEPNVVEEALKRIPGKPLINSIHLGQGEKLASKVLAMACRYGAGVIVMSIDEDGIAATAQKKIDIAQRIYKLATEKHGLRPQDLTFDPVTQSICTGRVEDRSAGMETLEAVRLLHQTLSECRTILGISHISSGLSGRSRRVLNSVFLKEAGDRGLDMAIVNFSEIDALEKIPEKEVDLARKLIFCDNGEGDPLREYTDYFAP